MAIVNINISILNPPKPSQLLKSGAMISQGGTTLTPGKYQLLTGSSDLSDYLKTVATTSIAWATGVVTVTLASPHGLTIGDDVLVAISGVAPSAYNGSVMATITSTTEFTYPLTTNPGTVTTQGNVIPPASLEINQMNTVFWAQGTRRAVYVLELGAGDSADGVSALSDFIAEDVSLGNTYQTFFSYLAPREWDTEPTFKTLVNNYTSPEYLVKFFVTTTINTYTAWVNAAYPNVYAGVEAPAVVGTEFSMASHFQSSLVNDPGSSNMVPPMAYRFLYGVTEYPPAGNGTLLKTLKANNINYVGDSAEGGLSNKMIVAGHMLDGNPFNYWYSVAWCAINLELDLANEVINGSNTTINPLYYDQDGIDRLQKRGLKTLRSGISYGLILGQVISTKLDQTTFNENFNEGDYSGSAVINAVPFSSYTSLNESAYADGEYGGLSAVMTPKRGFESITFNLNVTNFVG